MIQNTPFTIPDALQNEWTTDQNLKKGKGRRKAELLNGSRGSDQGGGIRID
jgi:hypothetical protein